MPVDAAAEKDLCLWKAWYGLGILMLLVVAVLSLMPVPDTGVGVNDKLAHVVTYFTLASWFALLAPQRAALLWTVVGLLAFGVLLEVLQGMTGYRYAEWADIAANASGTLVGALLYFTPLPRLFRLLDQGLARFVSG